VCLNDGCIPSKALLHAAKVIEDAADMAANGIVFGPPKIDRDLLRTWKDKVVTRLTNGLMLLAKQRKVTLIQGEAKFVGPYAFDVKGADGSRRVEFKQCVIAAGYESGRIAKLAGIGGGSGVLNVPLPVEPKKRYVYYHHCPSLSKVTDFPLVIDSTGVYVRPEGKPGMFFAGRSPSEEDEPSVENLDVDYMFFDEQVWPVLANRIPELGGLKVQSAWGGYYDYNVFDQNGVIGTHPQFRNFHIATGFSGHGIQQSPAVGRAIMEIILDGAFQTIDLTKFGFERCVEGTPVLEKNIV